MGMPRETIYNPMAQMSRSGLRFVVHAACYRAR